MDKEKIISFVSVFTTEDSLFTGRKPPDEISVIAKLKEVKVLKSNILKNINRNKVNKK